MHDHGLLRVIEAISRLHLIALAQKVVNFVARLVKQRFVVQQALVPNLLARTSTWNLPAYLRLLAVYAGHGGGVDHDALPGVAPAKLVRDAQDAAIDD